MTLPIIETWDMRGVSGPPYKVGPRCANPNCRRWAEHGHHMVRRSALAGEFNWVEIDGVVWQNKCGLCPPCHDDITGMVGGHKAAIRFEDANFSWNLVSYDEGGELVFHPTGNLDPQPKSLEEFQESVENVESDEPCPTCGSVRRRKTTPGARRQRKSWLVKVPDDELEHGAEVLNTLVEDLAVLLGVEPDVGGRYYVIVPTLAYAQMNRQAFIDSIAGKG